MPCNDWIETSTRTVAVQVESPFMKAALCAALRYLVHINHYTHFIAWVRKDKEAGVKASAVQTWWSDHMKADEARREAEREAEANKLKRKKLAMLLKQHGYSTSAAKRLLNEE